jgi:formylglycine-generating enzyme required for sulfatase activity
MSGCQSSVSGYAGVYDLSGNVWEWEDSCDGNAGNSDYCRLRGGSDVDNDYPLRCDVDNYNDRDFQYDLFGFRCCSSP